jgi:hypothetical protein
MMNINQQRIEEAHELAKIYKDFYLSMHQASNVVASGIASGMASSIVLSIRPAWVRRRDQMLARMEKAQGRR